MRESMRVRKEKMLARKRDRRLLRAGRLRLEQVSLASTAQMSPPPPLIFSKVHLSESEGVLDDDAE
jgi:hypothetical protein